MNTPDTNLEAEKVLIDILRNMPPARKGDLIFGILRMGRDIAIAGLRYRFPDATEEQIRLLLARQRLGSELFKEVYGEKTDELPG